MNTLELKTWPCVYHSHGARALRTPAVGAGGRLHGGPPPHSSWHLLLLPPLRSERKSLFPPGTAAFPPTRTKPQAGLALLLELSPRPLPFGLQALCQHLLQSPAGKFPPPTSSWRRPLLAKSIFSPSTDSTAWCPDTADLCSSQMKKLSQVSFLPLTVPIFCLAEVFPQLLLACRRRPTLLPWLHPVRVYT